MIITLILDNLNINISTVEINGYGQFAEQYLKCIRFYMEKRLKRRAHQAFLYLNQQEEIFFRIFGIFSA